jgi:hypothetical protein
VAAKNNIAIPTAADEEAYLNFLQSADATVASVNKFPDYINPRLSPALWSAGNARTGKPSRTS